MVEYRIFLKTVPKWERDPRHPSTPETSPRIPRRTFGREMVQWRRDLHRFSPSTGLTKVRNEHRFDVKDRTNVGGEQQKLPETSGSTSVVLPRRPKPFLDVFPLEIWQMIWHFAKTTFQRKIWDMWVQFVGVEQPLPPAWELERHILGGMAAGLQVGPSLWHFFGH